MKKIHDEIIKNFMPTFFFEVVKNSLFYSRAIVLELKDLQLMSTKNFLSLIAYFCEDAIYVSWLRD